MSERQQAPERRILVAIDMLSRGTSALETAARLATEMHAELQGLFIEDVNLLRLAGLPFAREIDLLSGELRPLDTAGMEHTLRTRAERVRLAIAETAQRTSLRWSFRVSRGNLAETMLAESLAADLFLIGREQAQPAGVSASVHRGPILVIDDGSRAFDRVLDTAQRLARAHSDVIVAIVADEGFDITELLGEASPVSYVQRCPRNVEALLQAVRRWQPQLVLIDRSNQLISKPTLDALVSQLPCPLVFVQ